MSDETLATEIKALSDNQLIARTAGYNALLRYGRKLIDEGQAIVTTNINPYVICKNELDSRLNDRIRQETDRLE
jgi:hypothetical protein